MAPSRSPSPHSRRAAAPYSRREQRPRSHSPGQRSSYPQPRRHSRSRSPKRRQDDRPRKSGSGGFRWKEKSHYENDDDGRDDRRLERGYREQARPRYRSPGRDGGRRDDVEAKFGRQKSPVEGEAKDRDGEGGSGGGEEPKREKRKKEKVVVAPVGQEMIIVNVNDRLGTKASIPCLASDPIKLFKAQVAARIGRQPHEIMLKRQGERPFKDQLTLEDYGVSNGVQLDLEIDTGD